MKLKDRVAVITGAELGIGRASALEFAREGTGVGVADINAAGAEEKATRIATLGGQGLALPTDVVDAASVQCLLQARLGTTAQVRVLFSNAAI